MRKSGISFILLLCQIIAFPVAGERPVAKQDYKFDRNQAYILVWAGPINGGDRFENLIRFSRMDPQSGKLLVEDSWTQLTVNARSQKDAAAVYFEPKPWIIENDRGLFLIPVNPGRWVISGVETTALSLGSYAFSVERGKIAYIGSVLVGEENGKSKIPEIKDLDSSKLVIDKKDDVRIFTVVLRNGEIGDIPKEFSRADIVMPAIERGVEFDNNMSSLVSRAADLGAMKHEAPVMRADVYSFSNQEQ